MAPEEIERLVLQPVEISAELPEKNTKKKLGLKINRHFTTQGESVFESVAWLKRDTIISDEKGSVISEIKDVETPNTWTQLASDILAYKYLRKAGVPTKEGRETSARQAIYRISQTMSDFGEKFNYFANHDDRVAFEDELTHLLLNQKAAFNSPVWFNCGLYHQYQINGQSGAWYWDFKEEKSRSTETAYRNPQCSACFILSVQDTLPGIFDLLKTESHIFKYGSGAGGNFSRLRSRYERLAGGGFSSGMMSFLRVFDRSAGATKSGGTTRRAAKMVVCDINHPEIEDFIDWKVKEEKKARALIAAGYEADFNGEAYSTVSGQNSNNSVRVTDEFMKAAETDGEWQTRLVVTGEPHKTYRAKELMRRIAEAAWYSADPGLQFDTTINHWHTVPNTGRINASNPCSEYMHLDDSACNLSSINLAKFITDDGKFDIPGYRQACRIMLTAQEIAVDLSSYPTEAIARNSHDYRPLGLGFANLGTLLMLKGISYDSPQALAIAGALTAIMCGYAYKTSAEIAAVKGPFKGFMKNRAPMLRVIRQHRAAAYRLDEHYCPEDLLDAARQDWDEAVALGEQFGFRNSQVTVIAPTGTIGLLMDCDTTGIEPDYSTVKFKKLAGGGSVKIVNRAVSQALTNLGYTDQERDEIIRYVLGEGKLVDRAPINRTTLLAKGLNDQDLEALDQALPGAFDFSFVFNGQVLGQATLERLAVSFEEQAEPTFSMLRKLGFTSDDITRTNEIVCGTQTLEGAPQLKLEHYPIFDCANRCGQKGTRYLSAMSHVRMMAAVQPFISGAISKTVNLPHEATVEDIEEVYWQSWKMGIKALAVYRDGSKVSQPLNSKKDEESAPEPKVEIRYQPHRRRLADERQAITHKFQVGGYEGYLTIGLYEDGSPGEIFVTMAKQGSVISGLMDSFATSISIALQYGVPLEALVNKFANARFEPSGLTNNPQIRMAKSIIDYIAKYLGLKFLTLDQQQRLGVITNTPVSGSQTKLDLKLTDEQPEPVTVIADQPVSNDTGAEDTGMAELSSAEDLAAQTDAPPCPNCGSITTRTGTCFTCLSCGSTTGGCS
ncbi:MAG: vitamin B12-dependent ribonucleotide reductase [Patescibacteria group bacterium]